MHGLITDAAAQQCEPRRSNLSDAGVVSYFKVRWRTTLLGQPLSSALLRASVSPASETYSCWTLGFDRRDCEQDLCAIGSALSEPFWGHCL